VRKNTRRYVPDPTDLLLHVLETKYEWERKKKKDRVPDEKNAKEKD
jgi:hypothetical protein